MFPLFYGRRAMKPFDKEIEVMSSNMDKGKFGVNMWWHVPVSVVDGELARSAVVAGGFDEKMLNEPTRHAEVSRATRSVAGRRKSKDKSIAEKVGDNSTDLVYGILDYGQEGEQAEYQQNTTVRMDKATGKVLVSGDKAEKVYAAVQAYEGKITDEDIRSFLVNVVRKCHGVSKRHGGGIYFIPASYVERVEAAREVLKQMGCRAKVYVERVVDGEQERANVWEACEDDIGKQIEATLAAVENIEKRASAVESKKAKLEELDEMMNVYKNLLGEEAKYEGLAERIEKAVKVVEQKMVQVQQGTASSVVKAAKQAVAAKVSVASAVAASNAKNGVPEVATANGVPEVATANGVPVVAAEDRIPVIEAAVAVLMKAGREMTSREIYEEAVREGWYVSNASDPYTSFVSVMSKSVAKGEKRVSKVGAGTWKSAA